MKKIIIMTQKFPYQKYFVNTLDNYIKNSDNLELSGVFLAGKRKYKDKIKKKIRKKGVINGVVSSLKSSVTTRIINRYTYPESEIEKTKVYNKIYNGTWKKINRQKVYYKEELLFSNWFEKIEEIEPDIIIVHGGGIVPKKIIGLAKQYTFNLHWGISPLYRGSFCSPFCVLNNEIENIGVTIHELTMQIDGGAIYSQDKPNIENHDTIFSIEMKLTQLGTKLIQNLLEKINGEEDLRNQEQDFNEGHLYLRKEYTVKKAKKVKKMIKSGIINEYIQSQGCSK